MDSAHGDVEQQPVGRVDEEQSRLFLREQIVGADRRDDEAERDAKGSQHFGDEVEIHRIGRECVRQCPRGDQAEGEGAAVDFSHAAFLELLFGKSDRAHPLLAHDRAIPDAADQKAGQCGNYDRNPVHVKYVHCILPDCAPAQAGVDLLYQNPDISAIGTGAGGAGLRPSAMVNGWRFRDGPRPLPGYGGAHGGGAGAAEH